ncbi:MAG: tetratricopeptide repeat protein [Vitreimonas sp.]
MAIDARAGLFAPAPIHAEYVVRGDEAVLGNVRYSSIGGDARDRFLRDYWRQQYDNVDISRVSVAFDPEARELRLAMDGFIRMNWAGDHFRVDDIALGYRADFHRDPTPNSDAPFAVAYPAYERMVATVQLPPGIGAFSIRGGEDVSLTAAGIEFRRRTEIRDNVFHGEASWRSVATEFPAADATAAQAAIRALNAQVVSLAAPSVYRPTEGDVAALAATAPTDAAGFIRRGNVYLGGNRYDEALADFDRAVALEPQNGLALANRGIARVWRGDLDAARRDLDGAAALAPDQIVIFRARGLLAQGERRMADAIAAYSRALAIDQNDAFSLGHRAEVYYATGEHERALGDAAAALRRNPRWTDLYLLRANIFRGRGDNASAAAEADALIAAVPEDTYARVVAARIYEAVGRRDDAMREIERALTMAPESYVYLNRASMRPKLDLEGRLTDISAALRLDPDSAEALTLRAEVLQERGDYQGAIADLTRALRATPADSGLLTRRGVNYALARRQALADADFAAARENADDPSVLNNMCWAKATAGVMLQSALADCDAALAQRPEAAGFLDSRGLVLLRLGRLDEAIAAYDRALAISPNMPTSLYGRGLARRLKGAEQEAQADLNAAAAIDAHIGAEFELYGLSPRPQ